MWYNFFGDIMLVDSHCHVLNSEYDNVDEIIKKTFEGDVKKIIVNGYDLKTSIDAVNLAEKYENIYAAIGIGPENVESYNDESMNILKKLVLSPKVVAVGEIGLDYYWTKENSQKQVIVFKSMLQLAKDNGLPVIVHSRNAIEQTYNILEEYNVEGIMHCFSGSKEMAKKFIQLGFLIGVGGIVTFKNSKKLVEVIENIDLKYISLETDSPYLTPEPYRGKVNVPFNTTLIAQKVADIKGVSYEEVANVTSSSVIVKFDLY